MATSDKLIPVGGRLHSIATEGQVAGADEIFDDVYDGGKFQNVINAEIKAEIGTDETANTIKGRISDIENAVGAGGSIDDRIASAVNALDSNKSQSAGADGLALNIVQTDGKIFSISGSIAAETYDPYGAANTAKTELLGGVDSNNNTLKKLKDTIDSSSAAILGDVETLDTLGKLEDALNSAIGEGGSVQEQITSNIDELDATVSQSSTGRPDGLALQVVQVNGKLDSVSGSIAAKTYDAYGDATRVKNDLTGTITGVRSDLTNEIDRAKATEKAISDALTAYEESNDAALLAEATARDAEDRRLAGLIEAEETRAKAIEGDTTGKSDLQTQITEEINRASGVEESLAASINSEVSQRKDNALHGVSYVPLASNGPKLRFQDGKSTPDIIDIDASKFVDAVSDVGISSGNNNRTLTVTYNSETGKSANTYDIGDVFESDNYYTKNEIDTTIQDINTTNNTLGNNKANKVSGATAGNLAKLDSSGDLVDSGILATNVKIKQNAISDPTASASDKATAFINTISQDANGVISVTKANLNIKKINNEEITGTGNLSLATTAELDTKANKANPVVAGHIATLLSDGSVADGGTSLSDYWTSTRVQQEISRVQIEAQQGIDGTYTMSQVDGMLRSKINRNGVSAVAGTGSAAGTITLQLRDALALQPATYYTYSEFLELYPDAIDIYPDAPTYAAASDNRKLKTPEYPAETAVTATVLVPSALDNINASIATLEEVGAEANVQANWNEANTASDAYIQNKPTNLSDFTDDIGVDTAKTKLAGIEAEAQVNKIENIAIGSGANLTVSSKKITLPTYEEGAQVNTIEHVNLNGTEGTYTAGTKTVDLSTASINNLTNYYKKTETYTQTEVDNLVNSVMLMGLPIVDEVATADYGGSTHYILKVNSKVILTSPVDVPCLIYKEELSTLPYYEGSVINGVTTNKFVFSDEQNNDKNLIPDFVPAFDNGVLTNGDLFLISGDGDNYKVELFNGAMFVQPDLDQTNPTALDYVKNKPTQTITIKNSNGSTAGSFKSYSKAANANIQITESDPVFTDSPAGRYVKQEFGATVYTGMDSYASTTYLRHQNSNDGKNEIKIDEQGIYLDPQITNAKTYYKGVEIATLQDVGNIDLLDGITKDDEGDLWKEKEGKQNPIMHPNITTQISLLPYRFGTLPVYEVALPYDTTTHDFDTSILPQDAVVIGGTIFSDDYCEALSCKWETVLEGGVSVRRLSIANVVNDFTPDWAIVRYFTKTEEGYYGYNSSVFWRLLSNSTTRVLVNGYGQIITFNQGNVFLKDSSNVISYSDVNSTVANDVSNYGYVTATANSLDSTYTFTIDNINYSITIGSPSSTIPMISNYSA